MKQQVYSLKHLLLEEELRIYVNQQRSLPQISSVFTKGIILLLIFQLIRLPCKAADTLMHNTLPGY